MSHLRLLFIATGIALRAASAAHPSGPVAAGACLGPDAFSKNLVQYMDTLVTSTDSETVAARNRYGLPVVSPSAVTLVSDTTVCRTYANAYSADVNPASPMVGRLVYVVQIGSNRFVVVDPNYRGGEWIGHIVFDNNQQVIARFAA
jgi:hypothetical protein